MTLITAREDQFGLIGLPTTQINNCFNWLNLNTYPVSLENQVELPFKVPVTNCTATGQSSQPALPSAVLTVVQGSKGYCKQMNSFEEARVFLNNLDSVA